MQFRIGFKFDQYTEETWKCFARRIEICRFVRTFAQNYILLRDILRIRIWYYRRVFHKAWSPLPIAKTTIHRYDARRDKSNAIARTMENSVRLPIDYITYILSACDNLADFTDQSRGVNHTPDARPLHNISEFVQLISTGVLNNVTCLNHAPQLTRVVVVKVIVLSVIAILSFVANVATIYSIAINRRKQHAWSAIYTLILHLTVADLLVTVFCMVGDAMWSYTVAWIFGNVACKLFKFAQVFSLYLSTFILVLIGVDRFFAIRYPMKGMNTADRCLKFVVLAWILSFIFASPQVRVATKPCSD